MNAKNLANLYWFCQSVEHGGFAAASQHSQVSAPTLSRAVIQLESEICEKLLHRNAKHFQLTATGEDYYKRFSPLFHQIREQWQSQSNRQPSLSGDIRISCPEPFADSFLQQAAVDFMNEHPQVNIHIKFSSDTQRFFDHQIDLAVATNPPRMANLVQRRLFKLDLALVASPEYISKYGHPTQIDDLTSHHLLAGNTVPHWEFKYKNRVHRIPLKPRYSIDSLRLIIEAACAGVGIALISKVTVDSHLQNGKLELLLPDVESASGAVYLVWSDRKLVSTRVAAFRNMIINRLDKTPEFLSELSTKN